MHRRHFIAVSTAGLFSSAAYAQSTPLISVVKSPTCGCCTAWVEHLIRNGFEVDVTDVEQDILNALKARLEISAELSGCHTAAVGNYFIEGHVPAQDIQRLIVEQPAARGLTVPGMPMGSPGMDGGGIVGTFEVLLVLPDGTTTVFAQHT